MLTVENLRKYFKDAQGRSSTGRVAAVDGVSFTIPEGEFFSLVGPSGCGKTTTLRSIAGLEAPDSGEIRLGGRTVFSTSTKVNVPASRRGLGMVFQSYAIWPHMDVWDNVAFPLVESPRRIRPSRKEVSARVEKALSVVRLDHLARRRATALSGGQQQRLALARALVIEPPLLLLDEPLSNLDAKLRESMRLELRRLQRELNITTLYVTHDQGEALAMSTTIGVMDGGRLEQIGPPSEIYERPASRFVADFVGNSNLLPGVVEELDESLVVVSTEMGRLRARGPKSLARGSQVELCVRPEHVTITKCIDGPDASQGVRGVVQMKAYHGDRLEYQVQCGKTFIRAHVSPSQLLMPGDEVDVGLPPEWCWTIQQDPPRGAASE